MKNINTFYRFGRNRNMGTIKTWEDVYNFLTKNGVNEQSLIKLVTNIDIENAHLFDIKIKLKGENYHSAFRSDFVNAIKDTQDAVNNVVLLLTEGHIRNLTDKEKEQLMFYVKVEQGSTDLTIWMTNIVLNTIDSILNTQSETRFYMLLGALIGFGTLVCSFSLLKFYKKQKDQKEIEITKSKDEYAYKALQLLVEKDQLTEEKVALANEVLQQKENYSYSIVRNANNIREITINDTVYGYHEIAKIKEEIDIPVRAKTKEIIGQFYVKGILKKNDTTIKLQLASTEDDKIEFGSNYIFADEDNKDAILDIFYNALKEDTILVLELSNDYNKNNKLYRSIIRYIHVEDIEK